MLRILNLVAIILYAVDGLILLGIRFFADHPAGYSMELFTLDLTVLCSFVVALGFFMLLKDKKMGLYVILVATAGHLILGPFTERAMYAPVYVVMAVIGWLLYRKINKPAVQSSK